MRKLLLFLIFSGILLNAFGQQQAQFSHYIGNQGILNPAYNGTRDIISGLVIHRSQWVGMDGAPMNQAINVHGPIEGTDIGVGVVLMNDNIGFTNTFDFMIASSYKLQVDRDKYLSLGLQVGASSLIYDGTKAVIADYGDPAIYGKESKMAFNVGFGSYFYSEDYFAGFSIPKFFTNGFDEDLNVYKNTLDFKNIHMYFYGGYIFEVNDYKVKPTILLKEVYGAPLQFDVSASVLIMDQVWVGLSYRSLAEAVLLTEYKINNQWTVRYSFDYPFTNINHVSKLGSHEIGIQFDFSLNRRPGMRSIRYF